MVEIRKSKREESLLKKQRDGMPQLRQSFIFVAQSPANAKKQLESLSTRVSGVYSDDLVRQLETTTQFKKLLSIECGPCIKKVIAVGVELWLVKFLVRADLP